MPIKGLNILEPSVEIRGLCSVINISRCPTNTDLRSGLWSSIVNQTSLKYVMNFSEKFTLFRKVPLQFWRNTTQISSGSSCFGKVDPHSRVEIILFLVLTLLQKLHFSRTLTPQLWNSNNGWRCYALLNWKFILIKSRRGISLNIPCKHFFLNRQIWSTHALPSQVSKTKSCIAVLSPLHLLTSPSFPSAGLWSLPQRSWKGENQNIPFKWLCILKIDICQRFSETFK